MRERNSVKGQRTSVNLDKDLYDFWFKHKETLDLSEESSKALRTRWGMWNTSTQDQIAPYLLELNEINDKSQKLEKEKDRLKSLIAFTEKEAMQKVEKDKQLLNDPVRGEKAIWVLQCVDAYTQKNLTSPKYKAMIDGLMRKFSLQAHQAIEIFELAQKKDWIYTFEERVEVRPEGKKLLGSMKDQPLPEPDFNSREALNSEFKKEMDDFSKRQVGK